MLVAGKGENIPMVDGIGWVVILVVQNIDLVWIERTNGWG